MFSLFENSQYCSNEYKEGIKEDLKVLSRKIHFAASILSIGFRRLKTRFLTNKSISRDSTFNLRKELHRKQKKVPGGDLCKRKIVYAFVKLTTYII
jgi:hypothetical protein